MFNKFFSALERLQIFCVSYLMQSLTKRGPRFKDDAILCSLLSIWKHSVLSKGLSQPRNLSSPALTSLDGQSLASAANSARSLLLNHLPPESWQLIPSLEARIDPVMNTWTFQNEVMEWDIGADELVLDIGSGGWPFKRANHLADKYPDETSHRVEAIVRDQRPFFEVDLEHLPFSDLEYDFVFCSHVLEHMDNPGQAIRELMRIGRRGYIEVPTRLSDIMFNFTRLPNHHRWHGLVLNNTLVLIEWDDWERRDLGNHFFNALHSEYKNPFQEFFERNRDLFFASFHWDDVINFLVIDKHGQIIDSH